MNTKNLILLSCLTLIFFSCQEAQNPEVFDIDKGILILNEGVWSGNNASITYYNEEKDSIVENAFYNVNGRQLGELASDIKQYGSKLYILIQGSNTIEITDLHLKSIKQISLEENIGQEPKYVRFQDGKAFITCFNGYLAVLDTAILEITNNIAVGKNPEGLAISNNKIYIACSGGLDFPNYDSTIAVVNLISLERESDLVVNLNPGIIETDNVGNIYILCNGDYSTINYSLVKIDANSGEILTIPNVSPADFIINGDKAYFFGINYTDFRTDYQIFDLETNTIINNNFLQNANISVYMPNALFFDNLSSKIILGDVVNYSSDGKIYIIDAVSGTCIKQFNCGIGPKKIITLK